MTTPIQLTTFNFDTVIAAVFTPGTRVTWERPQIGLVLDKATQTGTVVRTHGGLVEVAPDEAHPVLDALRMEPNRLEVIAA